MIRVNPDPKPNSRPKPPAPIPSLAVLEPEPASANVISTLEEVLAEALDGRVSSVAIAVVYRDGVAGSSWSDLPSRAAMLGAVSRLGHKINLEADQ